MVFACVLSFKNYLESLLSGGVEVGVVAADIQHQVVEGVSHGVHCVN